MQEEWRDLEGGYVQLVVMHLIQNPICVTHF